MKPFDAFKTQIEQAVALLALNGAPNVVAIPEGMGMVLVKDDTPEAEARKQHDAANLGEVKIQHIHYAPDGKKYLVCLD